MIAENEFFEMIFHSFHSYNARAGIEVNNGRKNIFQPLIFTNLTFTKQTRKFESNGKRKEKDRLLTRVGGSENFNLELPLALAFRTRINAHQPRCRICFAVFDEISGR